MRIIDIHTHCTRPADPLMDDYVKTMDEFGVEVALVHALELNMFHPIGANEDVRRAVERHPGRLYGSGYIDLRNRVDENIKAVEQYAKWGFKSIKVFPNLGFDPNQEKHEPVWAAVEAHHLNCLSHCGWLGPMTDKRWVSSITSSPFHFEVPARRHPGTNFIMGHFGGGATYLETVVLTSRLDNVFGDVTPGWGRWVFENKMPGLKALNFKQILYGTDNMGKKYGEDIAWWTKTLRALGCTREDLTNFFYNNGARILGLPEISTSAEAKRAAPVRAGRRLVRKRRR